MRKKAAGKNPGIKEKAEMEELVVIVLDVESAELIKSVGVKPLPQWVVFMLASTNRKSSAFGYRVRGKIYSPLKGGVVLPTGEKIQACCVLPLEEFNSWKNRSIS